MNKGSFIQQVFQCGSQENIVNMKKGTKVICSDNHGHSGRLSPGKMYDVLDEQE